jgi:hypothetical protein
MAEDIRGISYREPKEKRREKNRANRQWPIVRCGEEENIYNELESNTDDDDDDDNNP